ncbi:MAG: tetratricopeptide repeat protein [Xanthobacteraceae bacterium]|jgi:tetratricopeptide (TPR) repeat protein
MGLRFPLLRVGAAVAAAAFLCTAPNPGWTQEAQPPQAQPAQPVEPPAKLPRPQRGDRTQNLDFLFGALKAAPDNETAKAIEERIWALWFVSGSDTADLLMTRVKTAVEGKDLDLAVQLLDAIVEIKPDYVEAWNRRATLFFMKKDYGRALADIRQVLAREPRHFGALSGLGLIMQELGDDKRALDVFRRALAVHPHLERIPDVVKQLTEKVEGRDI